MTSIDDFPRDQSVMPEACRLFCMDLLDLLKGDEDNSFMGIVERISPVEISLQNATFTTQWLPAEIRQRLTTLPMPLDGDEIFADLSFTGSPNGKIALGQLTMQHVDSGHRLVLSSVAEDAATIVDYEQSGAERKTIVPEKLFHETLLQLMFGAVPTDLDDEKWRNIVMYFEQRSPVTERARELIHDTESATTTLRIVEGEADDNSTDTIELTVMSKFTPNIAYKHGIRVLVTEHGVKTNVSAHADHVKTLNCELSGDDSPTDVLDYTQAFVEIDADNNTWPCFPSESDIGILEAALQDLIADHALRQLQ